MTIQSPSGDEGDHSDDRLDDRMDDHVQVQILPQEDRWDANTAITDATTAYTGKERVGGGGGGGGGVVDVVVDVVGVSVLLIRCKTGGLME